MRHLEATSSTDYTAEDVHDHDHDHGHGPALEFDWGDGTSVEAAPNVVRTDEGIANFLRYEYWGGRGRQFDAGPDNDITVNLTGLTSSGRELARAALESWADVTGLDFVETSGRAEISFDDNQSGAFASSSFTSNGTITSSRVNISTDWIARYGTDFDSYSYQTYIHEIGHAIGLGHAGPYNGSASYPNDAAYLNDSWQATVMSYFSQRENTFVDASFAYILTPMPGDVIAVQDMYGTATDTRLGNTKYGFGQNHGEERLDFVNFDRPVALTIVDSGGIDILNLRYFTQDQTISLEAGTFSDVGGGTGNLTIARGTEIERAFAGAGDDTLIASSGNNVFRGFGGRDTFTFNGDDIGFNRIADFELGQDSIAFGEGLTLDDFTIRDRERGVVLVNGDNRIFVQGVSEAELFADDPFLIV